MRTKFRAPKYFLCSLTTKAARRLVAYYNRELAPLGLTAHQVLALGVLWRKEDLSLGRFAREAGIGKAAAVAMVRRLAAQGLVTRHPHPRDARLNVLRLTDKARRLAPRVAATVSRLEKKVEAALGVSGVEALTHGLGVINDLDL
ncbi:MAG: MarR family transcriptional regulator [Thermodesulfobacteriota bacterium]